MGRCLLLVVLLLISSSINAYPIQVTKLSNGVRIVYLVADVHNPARCGSESERLIRFQQWIELCEQAFAESGRCHVLAEMIGHKHQYTRSLGNSISTCFTPENAQKLRYFLHAFRLFYEKHLCPVGTQFYSIEPDMRLIFDDVRDACCGVSQSCSYSFQDFFNAVDMALKVEVRDAELSLLKECVALFKEGLKELGVTAYQLRNTPVSTLYAGATPALRSFLNKEIIEKFQSSLWQSINHGVEAQALRYILDPKASDTQFVFAGSFHTGKLCSYLTRHGYEATDIVPSAEFSAPCSLKALVSEVEVSTMRQALPCAG